ncbi:rhamnosyl/mannosyltransferase [Chitinophaga sp. YR573]|uniref:glycosyltransferase n=1 Tax=Chitinophaga sp. YR573 TaxID=1881040 RepID=UPI0008C8157C|nr:glycosyltransferase [Chitinophaga sp. YR573]SEW14496.1 rhamnosyl/mannosyltransferase [Chitinophaga sp. YR573]
MRILQLTKHYPPHIGGIETMTYDLTEGLNRAGVVCDVYCANDHNSTEEDEVRGYKVLRAARLAKMLSTSIAPALIKSLWKVRNQYDIIHVHFPDPMSALAIYLTRPKAKIVIHWHSDIIKQKMVLKVYLPLQNWILKRADAIIGTTSKYINESWQLKKVVNKTTPIPIGIRPGSLVVNDADVQMIREKYVGKRIVFSLGRLIYYKGFEYLIEAAQYLPDDVVVLIGGAGELELKLAGMVERLGLANKIVLLGPISHQLVGAYFKACDVFCLPSVERSEAFGIVLLEAMSFGKPIVAADIPGSGVPWVNHHHVTGLNVPVKDAKALSDGILQILGNRPLYDQFSANAYSRFKELFTDETMVQLCIKLYHDILS